MYLDWLPALTHSKSLIEKLKAVIPELLEENGLLTEGAADVPFEIQAERTEHTRRVA